MYLFSAIIIPIMILKISSQYLKKNKYHNKKYYTVSQFKYHKTMANFYENKL